MSGGLRAGVDRLRVPLALGLAALALAFGLTSGRGLEHDRADFAFCNQNEISSFDPAIATGAPEGRILRALYEGLTRPDPATLAPLPGMAHAWEESADGLTWRFHLRTDSRWTNGDPVTAHDFAWSWRRLLHPATGAAYANLLWMVVGARDYTSNASGEAPLFGAGPADDGVGIEAVSDTELLVRLATPTPYLPELAAYYPLYPVHHGCLERHGRRWIRVEHIVTNGPFAVAERRVRDRMRLVRHEGYWGADEVSLRTVDAYAADGNTTQLNMYLTGQVDWMIKPPTSLYDVLLPRPDVHAGPQFGMTFYRFNTTRPPFDDPRVREALTLALDRRSLAVDVMRGGEAPARSFVPPGFPSYTPAEMAPHDPERARALLAQAGYPGGEGFPPFEVLYPSNEMTRDFCAASVAQWRAELGIDAHLVNQVWKVYLDSSKQGLYDVAWSAWIGDYLDASTFLDIFTADSGNNRTGWRDDGYDALLGRAAAERDPAVRADLYRQAEQRLLDGYPVGVVYQRISLNLVSPRVRGFHDTLLDVHPLRDLSVHGPPGPWSPGDTR